MIEALYIVIDPNQVGYDKIMTENAVFDFATDIMDDENIKEQLRTYRTMDDKCKDGSLYRDFLLERALTYCGYRVKKVDTGSVSIYDDYLPLVNEVAPNRV